MVLDLERRLWQEGAAPTQCRQLLRDGIARYPEHVGLVARLALRYREAADWSYAPPDLAVMLATGGKTSTPLDLHFLLDDPAALAQAATTAAEHYRRMTPARRSPAPTAPTPGRRLRIGYASGDFREHALGQLAIGPIECHDRTRFEIFGYGLLSGDGSPLHRRFLAGFDHYRDLVGASADAILDAIQDDGIDILVHLSGYTRGGRCEILQARPAPITVNYLGFPGTLGMVDVDYIIGDPVVFGPDMLAHMREAPVALPDTYQPNRRPPPGPVAPDRASHGLPEDALVLACFCSAYKITEPVFARWMAVLRRVPGSVLWLLDHPRTAPGAQFRAAAIRNGVATDRIIMAPWLPTEAHLARLPLVDLALDTAPYGAHSTGSDFLWAGVPMVALLGQSFAARVSASLLRAAGLPDLVATDLDQYEEIIIGLAQDRNRLRALCSHLNNGRRTLPLFDAPRITGHLETALTIMWDIYCAGEPPRGFSVLPRQGSGNGSEWPNWA